MNITAHRNDSFSHSILWCFSQSDFTGKEKDYESGFHYFGARYYWSELLTGWLSVDPMADKYPSISPYAYCAWNPVKLVDPDGMEWDPASVDRIAEFRATTEQKKKDALTESEKNEFQKVLDELDALGRSNQVYHLEIGGTENSKRPGGTSYDLAKKWVSLNYDGTDKCLAHELKHAYQFEKGELSFSSKTGSLADVVTYNDGTIGNRVLLLRLTLKKNNSELLKTERVYIA